MRPAFGIAGFNCWKASEHPSPPSRTRASIGLLDKTEENDSIFFDPDTLIYGGYAQTKLIAEAMILKQKTTITQLVLID